ncbi:MAG: MBL fold metallo-hydrolase [Cyanobacteria bacterium P01_E01_bin.6]
MHLTYYGANSWLLQFDELRILVDPWLVGSLVFSKMDWLFKGDRTHPIEDIPENIDLILLSQGLEDHAHRPTLQKLQRTIPVIASPSGAKVVQSLGYSSVTALKPGDTYLFQETLEIRALSGAPIGLSIENGYWLNYRPHDMSLYYEPHGFPPSTLDDVGTVDVAISPIVNLELPLAGAIIQGHKTALTIAKTLKPTVFLPTASEGDIRYSGILDKILTVVGSDTQFKESLILEGLITQFVSPEPQVAFEISQP